MKGTSDPLFSFEYWYVNHKATLRTWWAVSLMLVMLAGMVWVAGFFALSYAQDQKLTTQVATSLTRLSSWTPAVLGTPEGLSLEAVATVLPTENGRYDVLTFITNPNTGWGATDVVVTCSNAGSSVTFPTTTVNPDERRPLYLPAQQVSNGSLECVLKSQTWNRDVAALFPQPSFSYQKKEVINTTAVVAGKTVPVVRVAATIRNDSGNNFQTVDVAMIIRRNDTIVAADILPLNRWETRGVKEVTNSWNLDQSSGLAVEIIPLVSRYNPEATY